MTRKRYTPEEIVTMLHQVDVLVSQGRNTDAIMSAMDVTNGTFLRWKNDYGGHSLEQVMKLKELETENSRLRRAVSDLTIDKYNLIDKALNADQKSIAQTNKL